MWDLWILLATRSFEEDAIIGNNSVILRETIGICVECRHCVHDVCACVLKNLPRVSQPLGNNFCKKKSRERRFAREKSVLPDASVRDKYRCHRAILESVEYSDRAIILYIYTCIYSHFIS